MPTATTDLHRIANLIRMRRAERGWTKRQLAEVAELSERTIQIVEGGERRVYDSTYGRLARALDIPLTDLIGEEV